MKRVGSAVLVAVACLGRPACAQDLDAAGFQQACRELLEIYKARDTERFFAWQTTSAAEAMRAGICRGTLSEYLRHPQCPRGWSVAATDWFAMAGRVVRVDLGTVRGLPDLLTVSACGYGAR